MNKFEPLHMIGTVAGDSPCGWGWGQGVSTLLWVVNMAVSKMAAMSELHVISQPSLVPGPSDP